MIRLFLREIRIEHTLFALPFAYVGAVIGAHGHPTWAQLFWITMAVFGARTAAMASNRLLDRKIDALNPRTAGRATATGQLSPQIMSAAIILGLLLTLISAYLLNPLCVKLLPIAAAGIFLYPLCKRFTWLTHFVLGAVDGFAPLGAVVAVSGSITIPGLLLFLGVTLWVGGFDIFYALMDLNVDQKQGISSIPARFGAKIADILPLVLHGLMAACLLGAGIIAHAHPAYLLGLLGAAVLIAYERHLVANMSDVFVLNDRVFHANMAFSVWFLLSTIGGFSFA